MGVFGINEMLDMQRALRERYGDKWGGLSPEIGKSQLLWMIGEIGSVSFRFVSQGETSFEA